MKDEKEQLPSAVDDAADVMSSYDRPAYDDPAPDGTDEPYDGPQLLPMTHEFLQQAPSEIDVEKEDLKQLKADLLKAMYYYQGIGLSANQVGIDGRYFVIGDGKEEEPFEKAFFNPQIISVSKDEDIMREGCLSFPGLWLMVKRPVQVTLKYINSEGEEMVETYEETTARVILHEYDHMLGANFTHRVSKLKLERGMKAMAKKHKKYQRQMRRYLQA